MSKHNLIDMIISGKSKKATYTKEANELIKEEAINVLKNNTLTKNNQK